LGGFFVDQGPPGRVSGTTRFIRRIIMNIRTVSLIVRAPRDTVFNFLADIESLPKWANGFCERVSLRRGRWWALTSQGELTVFTESDPRTGVIDLHAGPEADRTSLLPIRVLALSARTTLVGITLIQALEMSKEGYEQRYHTLVDEARGLLRRFGGGELFADPTQKDFAAHGAN
jgi:hypothetical protein